MTNPPASQTDYPATDLKNNKRNQTLKLLVMLTLTAYGLFLIGALILKAFASDSSGVNGLLLLPVVLTAWVMTPIGLVALVMLAVRSRKPFYIILCFLLFIAVVGFFAYDIIVVGKS